MRRQRVVVEEALAEAATDPDEISTCRRLLVVERQAAAYERYLAPWHDATSFDRVRHDIDGHRSTLRAWRAQASAEVERAGEVTRGSAQRGLGLRIAMVGKGGAGKTVVSATLARLLARRGRQVLAVDLDTNPGLAFSLGLPPGEAGLPADAIEQDEGANYGWQLAAGASPAGVVEHAAARGPDGVRFLGVGKISSIGKEAAKRSVAALVQVLLGFDRPGWDVIADLEAGPTTPFERYHAFAGDTLVVVGPAWRSAMTARRLWPMVESQRPAVVANRFGDEPDHPGLPAVARIPFDPCVAEAERCGLPPIERCPDAPAVRALDQLTDRYLEPASRPF